MTLHNVDWKRLDTAYQTALNSLLAERHEDGYWVGELSNSALSTAVAVMALFLVSKNVTGAEDHARLIEDGLNWLARHQNDDGGWGDTTKSVSNISTTMLCRAAIHLTGRAEQFSEQINHCEKWLGEHYGRTPQELAEAVRARYGKDRTFAVPILTTCALAGLVDWREVPRLNFELACFPQSWYRFLRLDVVSYALPALIAIGQCIHHHRPPWNPFARFVRWLAKKPSLRVLERIQPTNGGFLEATPLTSFVTLSLASIGHGNHPVARQGIAFIVDSVSQDGSWPIDTNLSTWVTTLSVNALAVAETLEHLEKKEELRSWLLAQQYKERHAYTGAAPGGWAWTPLPGGVPDADDTPGVLLALANLGLPEENWSVAKSGIKWLANLQNVDGGMPTFCRGWGKLPFDRSGSDLTAHTLRALWQWRAKSNGKLFDRGFRTLDPDGPRDDQVIEFGLDYLAKTQKPDGSWLPLWFGNQYAPDDINPTYGTARVLAMYRDLDMMNTEPAQKGITWLIANQNSDGGWGGCRDTPSSMEETALALEVLLDAKQAAEAKPRAADAGAGAAVNKGLVWLVEHVETGGLQNPSPIGFYFAKLWYFEKLYPIIFTVAALGKARNIAACEED